jgi:hypothetical protein
MTTLLALGACDPRFIRGSDLSAVQIEHLAGTWTGEGTLSFSSSNSCPRVYLWTLHVAKGNVDGSFVDKATPDAQRATFSTFIDYDGSVHAEVLTAGTDFMVLGTFNRDGFIGTARSPLCRYALELDQQGKAS